MNNDNADKYCRTANQLLDAISREIEEIRKEMRNEFLKSDAPGPEGGAEE